MKAFHAKIWQFAELKNPINVNSPFFPLGALQWYQKTSDCHHTRGKASNKVFDRVNILGSSPFPIIGTLKPFLKSAVDWNPNISTPSILPPPL